MAGLSVEPRPVLGAIAVAVRPVAKAPTGVVEIVSDAGLPVGMVYCNDLTIVEAVGRELLHGMARRRASQRVLEMDGKAWGLEMRRPRHGLKRSSGEECRCAHFG